MRSSPFDDSDDVAGYNSEAASGTLSPLPGVLVHGLGAVATLAFVSFLTTVSLFAYLSYKLFEWQFGSLPDTSDAASTTNKLRRSRSSSLAPTFGFRSEPALPIFDVNGRIVPSAHLCPQHDSEKTPWDSDVESRPASVPGGVEAAAASGWQRVRRDSPNQFLVLIYNLLFADIQQALAFLLNVTWLARDGVQVGTDTCWAQGWFVSTGDLASSVFISAIAAHTYLGVVQGYRLPSWAFYSAIAVLWSFVYGMALLGVVVTKNGDDDGGLYVRAGAWCWINAAYQDMRLYIHYLWIFLSLAVTSITYIVIFVHLHMHSKHCSPNCHSLTRSASSSPSVLSVLAAEHYPNADPNGSSPNAVAPFSSSPPPPSSPRSIVTASTAPSSTAKRLPSLPSSARHNTFLLYPVIYLLCTMPLAAGRIASMAGHDVSLGYFCFAGAMIASAGWLDVALYASTRRAIVFSGAAPPGPDTGLDTFAFMHPADEAHFFGNRVVVSGGAAVSGGTERRRWDRWNGEVLAGARLKTLGRKKTVGGKIGGNLRAMARGGKNESRETLGSTLKGFGMGGGEVMGMAIQCETVTEVVVERVVDSGAGEGGVGGVQKG